LVDEKTNNQFVKIGNVVYACFGYYSYPIWDNGYIEPDKQKRKFGKQFANDGRRYFYSYRKINDQFTFYGNDTDNETYFNIWDNGTKREFALPFQGSFRIIGSDANGVYYNISTTKNKIKHDRIQYFSFSEEKSIDEIEVPDIRYFTPQWRFVYSEVGIYYLLCAKDGIYLYLLTRTNDKTNGKNKFPEKFNYHYHVGDENKDKNSYRPELSEPGYEKK